MCDRCSLARTLGLKDIEIKHRSPLNTIPSSTESWSRTSKYGVTCTGRSALVSGHSFLITSLRAWTELSFRLSQQIFSTLALWIGGKLTIRISSSLLRDALESVSAKYISRLYFCRQRSILWRRLGVLQQTLFDCKQWAVVVQLASVRLSEREVPGSIFSDFNVCFNFPLIRVAIALNTRKTEHWQWQGGRGRTVGFHW